MIENRIDRLSQSDIRRFWDKVAVRGDDECWPWTAAKDRKCYGLFGMTLRGKWRNVFATHVSLELEGFHRPLGACALHSCDNPECVNPRHLKWGTHRENIHDMMRKGRENKPGAIGANNGKAKLNPEAVIDIRSKRESITRTAARYGVSVTHIKRIRRGQFWHKALASATGNRVVNVDG